MPEYIQVTPRGLVQTGDCMSTIMEGLYEKHDVYADGEDPFVAAIYNLFGRYFTEKYSAEWRRLDDNSRVYNGDHWTNFGGNDKEASSLPRPNIPTLSSAIENLKADYNDEFPEAVIVKESVHSELLAKVLTAIVRQELDLCGFEVEYGNIVQDILQDGWGCFEVGYNPDANNGMGGSFIRTIMNKNFLCDPSVRDLQDGRACFKIDMKPKYWFKQRYPKQFPYMKDDREYIQFNHETITDADNNMSNSTYALIEIWVREYDPETCRHKVHFAKVAGHQLLELSTEAYPNGYYAHGLYPFVVTSLFPQRGTELGLGLVDIFKDPQRYNDKAVQIILSNLYRAAKPRMILDENYLANPDEVLDMNNEVIRVRGNVAQAYAWQQAQPLPNTAFGVVDYLSGVIKNESGTNDQSRGQTTAGVTAASAITALQEMSTKRSRMGAQRLQFSFRKAVNMLLDVIKEKHLVPRDLEITVAGEPLIVKFDRDWIRDQMKESDGTPIVPFVTVKSARQTRYSKMMHNELVLQMMQATQGSTDPVLMFEAFEYDEKETILDTIRKAQRGGMLNLTRQVQEQAQIIQELSQQLEDYQKAMAGAKANLRQMSAMQAQQTQEQMQAQQDQMIEGEAGLTAENMF